MNTGFCRVLDFDFINKVLENILSLKDTDEMDYDHFDSDKMFELLNEVYSELVVESINGL